jgi:predicted porin
LIENGIIHSLHPLEKTMKKSLIALSVLAAVAGSAQAQSSVTVYGVLDMAFNAEHNGAGAPGNKFAVDSGIQSGSRLGFKGLKIWVTV